MKIEIDTSRDSTEDIKKAIRALRAIIGESTNEYSASTQDTPEPTTGAFNMFEDDSSTSNYDNDDKPEPEPEQDSKVEIIEY